MSDAFGPTGQLATSDPLSLFSFIRGGPTNLKGSELTIRLDATKKTVSLNATQTSAPSLNGSVK